MKKKVKQKAKTSKEKKEESLDQQVEVNVAENTTETENTESAEVKGEETNEALDELALLNQQKEALEAENQDLKNELLRRQADFTNFRKRKEKEAEDSIRYANISFMKSLLPIFDNLDRSLKAIKKADNMSAVEEGVEIIRSYTEKQFKKLGIEVIESKEKAFDSELHEAISAVPVEEEEKKGIVIDEVEKGYKLKEKIIRFSKVIVGE